MFGLLKPNIGLHFRLGEVLKLVEEAPLLRA